MLIGILSDTHDDMEAIGKAVIYFNESGAKRVLHAGDYVSPFTFEILSGLKAELTGIFGNNDGDRLLLRDKSGGRIFNQPLMLDLDGKRTVVVHEPSAVESLAKSGDYAIVIYGHTHEPDIRKVGNALIVNPGKAARLHKGGSTVVLLDTNTMKTELIELLK